MPPGAIAAIVVFAGFFVAWAVIPTFVKKHHSSRAEE